MTQPIVTAPAGTQPASTGPASTGPALPRRHFALLFTALLTVAAGNTALQSVLPAIARVIHLPDMLVAVIFSFSALLWTFSAPYWARQSDIRGRKLLTIVGVVGFGVSMLGCGFAILAGLHGWLAPVATFAVFAVLRSLFGIFGSATNPATQAYVAARTTEGERTNALSSLSSAFGLGTIIGPALAPLFILGTLGLAGPLFAFAAIAVVVIVAVARGLPNDDPTRFSRADLRHHGAPSSEPSVGGVSTGASTIAADAGRRTRLELSDPRIAPLMIFGFASGSIQAATGQTLGFLVIDRMGGSALAAQASISIVFMAGAGATLLAQWGLIPKLRLMPPQLLRWGTLFAGLGTLGIALGHSFHTLVLSYALTSLGYGFARPGFTAGASLAVADSEQGAVAGAVTQVNGACFVLAPAVGIGLYQFDHALPYWLAAAALVGLFAYTCLNRTLRRERVH
ncbi:MFS transporter [Sphingosinicellaceae bacterium]|nr:MFS transporter [Sphingosinicellaceae bacterium]